jgi:hypothetical protein
MLEDVSEALLEAGLVEPVLLPWISSSADGSMLMAPH